MKWFFPPNNFGQDSGFHDAGVETFKGNLNHYLGREAIQNSIDAQHDPGEPVRVSFSQAELSVQQIPGAADLRDRMEYCKTYWPSARHGKKFFGRAAAILQQDKVVVLRISDYNTRGVQGSDTDREGGWYSLVKCAGSSSKGGTEGGSFGIGKNSPFAASSLRTVLYSTLNIDDERAFQGVAHLVTHEDAQGGKAQATGYLGGENGASVRDHREIPRIFQRSQIGTDIWIVGYSGGERWAKEVTFSVLENFWPAIVKGKLTVDVGGTSITSATLPGLLELYSAESDFTAHMFYAAAVNPSYSHEEEIPLLGKVSLRLADGSPSLPKRIAMVRKTGMVVFHKQFRSVVPFAGLFDCEDKRGNKALRESEPPRHDAWDPDRPEPRASRKVIDALNDWIRSKIKEMKATEPAKIIEIPDLYKWLPDDESALEEGTEPEADQDTRESWRRSPEVEPVVIRPLAPKQHATEPDSLAVEGSGDAYAGKPGEGEQAGGGPGGGENEGEGGTGGTGADADKQREGGTAGVGGDGGAEPKLPIPVRSRIFLAEPATGTYRVVMEPAQTAVADVRVFAVGDDATVVPMIVREAWLDDGTKLVLEADGTLITGLSFETKQVTRMWARVDSADRLSLEVTAHEA